MKQLYVTYPSKYKFLVTLANSPSTFSSIINSVIGLFQRFNNRQNNSNKHKGKHQKQSVTEASNFETIHNTNGDKGINLSTDTIQEIDVSDLVMHHDACDTPSLQKDLFQNSVQNEMLTHYNRIVIGCFKDFISVH